MTRLEAACDAYHRSFGRYPDYHAMQSALDAADAWKDDPIATDEIEITATYLFDDRTETKTFRMPKSEFMAWTKNQPAHLTGYDRKDIARRSLAQSFSDHFAEEFRKWDHSRGDVGPHTMSRIIGVALEKAFEERERK